MMYMKSVSGQAYALHIIPTVDVIMLEVEPVETVWIWKLTFPF